MAGYTLLLVDADDTLFDFSAAERAALRDTFTRFSLPTDEASLAQYHAINVRLWAELERGTIRPERLRVRRFEEFLAEIGARIGADEVSRYFISALGAQAVPLPGAEQAVARWAQRVPVVIITNGIAAVQRARFSHSPMNAHISAIVISEEVGAAKPDARMVDAALAGVPGTRKEDALLVGDSLSADIAAAHNAGIASCWYNPARKPNHSPYRPTHEIHTLDAVDALLS